MDLTLNNIQLLIYHKTRPNQTKSIKKYHKELTICAIAECLYSVQILDLIFFYFDKFHFIYIGSSMR